MPLPRIVARFNRDVFNRVTRPLAGRVAPVTLVRHTGRTSGKAFETPVFAFRDGDRFVFALTYGPNADWVKNVVASDGSRIVYRGQTFTLSNPRVIVADPRNQPLPAVIRVALGWLKVRDFMETSIRA